MAIHGELRVRGNAEVVGRGGMPGESEMPIRGSVRCVLSGPAGGGVVASVHSTHHEKQRSRIARLVSSVPERVPGILADAVDVHGAGVFSSLASTVDRHGALCRYGAGAPVVVDLHLRPAERYGDHWRVSCVRSCLVDDAGEMNFLDFLGIRCESACTISNELETFLIPYFQGMGVTRTETR